MTNFRNRLINPIHRDFLSLCSMPLSVPPLMGTKKSLFQYSVLKEVYSFIVVPKMVDRKGLKKEGIVKPIPPN